MLGVPDAYELPSAPGNGYLKVDVAEMTRFKAAYVSGPADPATATPAAPRRLAPVIVPYGPEYIRPREVPAPDGQPGPPAPAAGSAGPGLPGTGQLNTGQLERGQPETLLGRLVRQLTGQGAAARPDLAAAAQPGARR